MSWYLGSILLYLSYVQLLEEQLLFLLRTWQVQSSIKAPVRHSHESIVNRL